MTPAPPYAPPPFPAPRPPRRGRVGLFVAIGCGTFFLIVLGFAFMVTLGVMKVMKSSDVYQHTLVRAEASPTLAAKIGAPIEERGLFVSGSIQEANGSGSAHVSVPVEGPKGRATVVVDAHKTGGAWIYDSMTAEVDDGSGAFAIEP